MAKLPRTALTSLSLGTLQQLARRRAGEKAPSTTRTVKHADAARRQFPATAAQRSIWLLDQSLEDGRAYNNPYAVTCNVEQPIDIAALNEALKCMIEKHAILRTTFSVIAGALCQCVSDDVPITVQYDDIQSVPETARRQWVEKTARQAGRCRFDLACGPLLRWRIIRTHLHGYVFLLTFHHIISDGWSVNLFLQECLAMYGQICRGETPSTAGFLQFSDYALAQVQRVQTAEYQQGLAYWARALEGVQGELLLPGDRPRPATIGTHGSLVSEAYDHHVMQRVQRTASGAGATSFHTVLAAYLLLLHKYSGQSQIVIGCPFANRNQPETQAMLGLFMNTLPLVFTLSPTMTLGDVIADARRVSAQAQRHQAIALSDILEHIDHQRNPQLNPLFQAALTWQVFPHFQHAARFTHRPLKIDYGVCKLDLNLWVEESDGGWLITLHYNADIFDHHTAARLLRDFGSVLEAMSAQPALTVRELSLVSDEARRHLLRECQRPPAVAPLPVHRQFELQAALLAEDAIALRCEGRTLSYRQLNAQANRLAHGLLANGLQPGQSVALYMAKSERCVVALLAVLKAGGCYVPVDIALPAAQVDFMLRDARAQLVLVDADSPPLAHPTLPMDRLSAALLDTTPQVTAPAADAPAYIIFTSGSSGWPKGVRITHAQLSHYCRAIAPVLDQPRGARYGMFSAFTSDLAHTMLFPALIHQGQLEVISQRQLNDPRALYGYLRKAPLDCAKITPSHLAALLRAPQADALLPRRLCVLGGERVPLSLVAQLRQRQPACRIVNHYGPTECTVGVTTYAVPDGPLDALPDVLPIGKPLANCHVLILDDNQQLVASGLPGEICLGGAQVAAGYVGLDEQHRARFIPHPCLPGERLYRTGDRGRWLAGGNLAFLGRDDRQIKIRGYRVNLADVECILLQDAGVTQAAVKRWSPGNDEHRLVAYCCGEAPYAGIQARLHHALPHMMRPDCWVWLDRLPRTASGKVDYGALPLPTDAVFDVVQAPDGETKRQLYAIYCRVLACERLDTRADFFTLGGNSLTALKLIIDINQHFGTALTIGQLMAHGSVSQLAAMLDRENPQAASPLVMLNAGQAAQKPTLLLVHPAGGNLACYLPLVRALGDDYPVYGLQITDFRQDRACNHDIAALAADYLAQAKAIAQRQNLVLGGWSLGATVAFEMAQQIYQADGRTPTVLIFDQPAPHQCAAAAALKADVDPLMQFARRVERFTGGAFSIDVPALAALSEAQRGAAFLAAFRRAKLVPDRLDVAHFRHFLTVLQAHSAATEHYRGKLYPGYILLAEAQERLPDEAMPPGGGWASLAGKGITIISAPGDHISMMTEPHISQTAVQLRTRLV